ncbi:MAG: DUF4230 domain-containing protein [Ardenticatenaceae bacterium]|nr:DUF4230 domain-containing protein [Ardenticatenaceae bacterium]HBY98692.1 DUF4230 domain-containing protein [Chloroflexota bacterium]
MSYLEPLLPPAAPPPERRGCVSAITSVLLLLLGGAILFIALVGFGIYQVGEGFFGRVEQLFRAPQPTPVVDTRSVVVQQIRGVSELTTAIFAMQAVADASKDRTLGPFTVGKTRLLYVAYGEVRAGVDLSQIKPEDVTVATDTIVITLPPPRLIDKKLDVDKSYVYDLQESLFAPPSPELQSRAEQNALRQIVAAACEDDILGIANQKAELAVGSLLHAAGYRNVTVLTQPPNRADCAMQ